RGHDPRSLHDALPISASWVRSPARPFPPRGAKPRRRKTTRMTSPPTPPRPAKIVRRSLSTNLRHDLSLFHAGGPCAVRRNAPWQDRKSTRLNSSHVKI